MASIYQNWLGTNRQCYIRFDIDRGNIIFYTTFNIFQTTFNALIKRSICQSSASEICRKLVFYLASTFGIYQVEAI